jgi:hypothetical protein
MKIGMMLIWSEALWLSAARTECDALPLMALLEIIGRWLTA